MSYWNIEDLKRDLPKVVPPWTVLASDTEVRIGIVEDCDVNTLVIIKSNLDATVKLNKIPVSGHFTFKDDKVCSVLAGIHAIEPCKGETSEEFQNFASLPSADCAYYRHAVCTFEQGKMRHSSTVRSSRCLGRAGEGGLCLECTKVRVLLQRKSERSLRGVTQRLATTTRLRMLAKERLVTALRDSRESVRQLTKDKATILKKLTTECVPVNDSLHKSLKDVLIAEDITDPFLKMFWSEQSKAFSKQKGGMRWHPMLIRFAILLHTQSPAAYNTLRQTGALKLPGESTLRDYTNAVHPQDGFNGEVVEEVKKATATLKEHQRYVVLLHDEMAIKSDLVHDVVTDQVVGFVNHSDWTTTSPTESDLASHVLVFMVVGVSSHLKMSLGYFPTKAATHVFLYQTFWRAVGILELQCGLKVCAYDVWHVCGPRVCLKDEHPCIINSFY